MSVLEILIYFFAEIYMVYFLLNSFANIDNINFNFCKDFKTKIIVSIYAILLLLNSINNNTEYKMLITFLLIILLYYTYFKSGLRNSIYNAAIIIIFNSIIEILLSLIMYIGISNYIVLNNNNILLKIFFSFVVFGISNKIFSIKKITIIIIKVKEILEQNISLEIILASIIVILNIFSFFRSKDFNNTYNIISIAIGIIYIILTFGIIVKSKLLVQKLTVKNKELCNSYKIYSETIQEFRELKHNLKNDLYIIKSNLPKEKQTYINDVISKYNKQQNWINNIEDMPEGLQGLIYLKKNEAEKTKIKMIINYNSNQKIQENDFIDICDILGILIDNSIEASKKSPKKILLVDAIDYNNHIEIKIINTFTNKIDINSIGNKDYSTKKKKSGLGLNYIKKINNNKINVELSVINDLFIAKIIYKTLK